MMIKTRFAPSPTGYLHIGGIRTALYSWLFARRHKGKFILRIEDTDLERSTQKAIDAIIDGMHWLNLDWDEGPYYQTKRFDRYNTVIDNMLANGTAYKCYCSKERLNHLRYIQMIHGEKPRYDAYCRNKQNDCSDNIPHVVRFKNPKEGFVIFKDQIRGLIEFNNAELDDLIIRRTDGSPTYNFCVVVDDWDMKITHVIRGEEHINNTPRQINIMKAIGATVPIYAHVSMILGEDGKKLSKRHNSIDIMQYRDEGYLPEAVLNYLLRLGWSYGDQEIFSIYEMQRLFSLDAISKSACILNTKKLQWLNQHYISTLPPEYVATYLKWQIEKEKIDTSTGPEVIQLIKLFGRRFKTLKEMAADYRYFYEEFNSFDANAAKRYFSPEARKILEHIHNRFTNIIDWTEDNIYHTIQIVSNELQVSIREVNMPLRVAVINTDQSPRLSAIIYAIGKLRTMERLEKAINFISKS